MDTTNKYDLSLGNFLQIFGGRSRLYADIQAPNSSVGAVLKFFTPGSIKFAKYAEKFLDFPHRPSYINSDFIPPTEYFAQIKVPSSYSDDDDSILLAHTVDLQNDRRDNFLHCIIAKNQHMKNQALANVFNLFSAMYDDYNPQEIDRLSGTAKNFTISAEWNNYSYNPTESSSWNYYLNCAYEALKKTINPNIPIIKYLELLNLIYDDIRLRYLNKTKPLVIIVPPKAYNYNKLTFNHRSLDRHYALEILAGFILILKPDARMQMQFSSFDYPNLDQSDSIFDLFMTLPFQASPSVKEKLLNKYIIIDLEEFLFKPPVENPVKRPAQIFDFIAPEHFFDQDAQTFLNSWINFRRQQYSQYSCFVDYFDKMLNSLPPQDLAVLDFLFEAIKTNDLKTQYIVPWLLLPEIFDTRSDIIIKKFSELNFLTEEKKELGWLKHLLLKWNECPSNDLKEIEYRIIFWTKFFQFKSPNIDSRNLDYLKSPHKEVKEVFNKLLEGFANILLLWQKFPEHLWLEGKKLRFTLNWLKKQIPFFKDNHLKLSLLEKIVEYIINNYSRKDDDLIYLKNLYWALHIVNNDYQIYSDEDWELERIITSTNEPVSVELWENLVDKNYPAHFLIILKHDIRLNNPIARNRYNILLLIVNTVRQINQLKEKIREICLKDSNLNFSKALSNARIFNDEQSFTNAVSFLAKNHIKINC